MVSTLPGIPNILPNILHLHPPPPPTLVGEGFSLQMNICLCYTKQFDTCDSESTLLRSLFILSALIITVMNKLSGAEIRDGSQWTLKIISSDECAEARPLSNASAFAPLILQTIDKDNSIDETHLIKKLY